MVKEGANKEALMFLCRQKFIEDPRIGIGEKGVRYVFLDRIFHSGLIEPEDAMLYSDLVRWKGQGLRIVAGSIVIDCTTKMKHELQVVFSEDLKLRSAAADGKRITTPLPEVHLITK